MPATVISAGDDLKHLILSTYVQLSTCNSYAHGCRCSYYSGRKCLSGGDAQAAYAQEESFTCQHQWSPGKGSFAAHRAYRDMAVERKVRFVSLHCDAVGVPDGIGDIISLEDL